MKMNPYCTLSFIILLSLLVNISIQANLIPDPANPLLFNPPRTGAPGSIILKFSFPKDDQVSLAIRKNGSGLAIKQYIAVGFPALMTNQLSFNGIIRHTCTMTDGTDTYMLTPVQSIASQIYNGIEGEGNIAYCMVEDTVANYAFFPLKTGQDIVYTLTVSFDFQFSTNYIGPISLFTSTANTPEKIIIDSLPVIGTLALYNDYTNFAKVKRMLEIISTEIRVTSPSDGSSAKIYPNYVFDLYLSLKCNSYITASDFFIVFGYPTDIVSPPTGVLTYAYGTKSSQVGIGGTLSIIPFGTGMNTYTSNLQMTTGKVMIIGVTENLVPGRTFIIALKSFTALNRNFGMTKPIEVFTYYKNTYSVASYHSSSILKINPVEMTVQAGHPDGSDLWRNGAWPLTFKITPLYTILPDGYVVVRHSNYSSSHIMTFIASTCDFSQMPKEFHNTFYQRNSCFPLRLDHKYPVIPYGSGFFFRFDTPLVAKVELVITIWTFADKCGGDSYNPLNGTGYSIPQFSVEVYKDLIASNIGESRFAQNTAVAKAVNVNLANKCWNNYISTHEATTLPLYLQSTTSNLYPAITADDAAKGVDVLLYKEFTDWQIVSQISNNRCDPGQTDCWAVNMGSNTVYSEKFLYSTSNQITDNSGSFFLVRALANKPANAKITELFPINLSTAAGVNTPPGKLLVLMSPKWFIAGEPYWGQSASCYLSWGFTDGNPQYTQTKLIQTTDDIKAQANNSNFISAANQQIDLNNSMIPPNNGRNLIKIISIYYWGNRITDNKFKFADTADLESTQNTPAQFGLLTTCIKWATTLPTITTIYTSIDIQVQWNYVYGSDPTSLGVPTKNFRLIKLFPEGGVFHDYAKINENSSTFASVSPYRNHYAFGTDHLENSICLLEFDTSSFIKMKDTKSDTLLIWLMFASLLESDYSVPAASYPAGPLAESVTVLGLSSQAMHSENWYINTDNTAPQLPLMLRTDYNSFGSSGETVTAVSKSGVSNYLFYMGSMLIVDNIKYNNITSTLSSGIVPNLLIPYYCPHFISVNPVFGFFPTLVANYATMAGSYGTPVEINRYIVHSDSNAGKYYTILLPYYPQKGYNVSSLEKATTDNLATLRFEPYTTSSSSNVLYIYNGNTVSSGTTLSCTGHVLLIRKDILITSEISLTVGYSGNLAVFNPIFKSSQFYAFGKAFNRAILYGSSGNYFSGNMLGKDVNASNSPTYYTGIIRPSLDVFVKKDSNCLDTRDLIAYSCASEQANDFSYLSNHYAENLSSINMFLLDWNPSLDSSVWTTQPLLSYDSTSVYKNDYAGNIQVKLTTPTYVPSQTQIKLSSDEAFFGVNTICGLMTASSVYAVPCNRQNGKGNVSCTIPTGGTSYTICCYNVIMTGNQFSLSSLTVNFPPNSMEIEGIESFISSTIYSASSLSSSLELNLSTNKEFNYAYISRVKLNPPQEGAIGEMTLEILLNRRIVRDMKVILNGDLTQVNLRDMETRCSVNTSGNGRSVPSDWASGDALIESCGVDFLNTLTPIIITTKPMIYKCGMTLSNTLYVTIWPVLITNITEIPGRYSIALVLKDNSAISDNTHQLLYSGIKLWDGTSFNTMKPYLRNDSIISLTKIYPSFPGDYADYTFKIDFDSTNTKMELLKNETLINEITVYWNYPEFGAYFASPIIQCVGVYTLSCSFIDEGVLSIRFPNPLTLYAGVFEVKVIGVINPSIATDLSFAWALNYYENDQLARKRVAKVVGLGTITDGTRLNLLEKISNLRIYAYKTPVSSSIIRATSTHTFLVSFDTANSMITYPIEFTSSPVIHIYFPDEYYLPGSKVTASILEYTSASTSPTTLTDLIATQSGNRITIMISQSSYTIPSTFKYWQVQLNNVINPANPTSRTPPSSTQSTKAFSISITNLEESVLYRTFTNLNTYSSKYSIETKDKDIALQWNRGIEFSYDSSKWLIDVTAPSVSSSSTANLSGTVNVITVKSGRFALATFSLSNLVQMMKLSPAVTIITLNDSTFKTSKAYYKVATFYMQNVEFYIGCSCGTVIGTYIVSFSSSEQTKFHPLAPLVINVDDSSKALISVKNVNDRVSLGYSAWVWIELSELNVDFLSVTWNVGLVTVASLSSVTLPPQTSRIFSYLTVPTLTASSGGVIKFTTVDPNNCFSWVSNEISISVDSTSSTPSGALIPLKFKYYPSGDRTSNVLQFSFTSPAFPIYIYCALICNNQSYPDTLPLSFTTPLETFSLPSGTTLSQYYYDYIYKAGTVDLQFTGLLRGESYKLKCWVQSTQVNETLRTTQNETLETYEGKPFVAPSRLDSRCVKFNYKSSPNSANVMELIHSCQRKFSEKGFNASSCIICTDVEMKYTSTGIDLPNSQPSYVSSITALRELQTVNTNLQPEICAFQHPECSLSSLSDATFEEMFSSYINLVYLNVSSLLVPYPYTIKTDVDIPKISRLIYNITNATTSGYIKWNATYQDGTAACYWMVAPSNSSNVTIADLISCSDSTKCGKFRTGTSWKSHDVTVKTLFSGNSTFKVGDSYLFFVGCSNDVPFSQKFTDVVSTTFLISNTTNANVTNFTTCTNGTTILATCEACHIAFYFYFIWLQMLFVLLLF